VSHIHTDTHAREDLGYVFAQRRTFSHPNMLIQRSESGPFESPPSATCCIPSTCATNYCSNLVSGRRGAHAQHHGLPTLNGRSAAVLRPLAKIERRVARAARSSIAILLMLVAAVCACVVPTLSRILLVLCFFTPNSYCRWSGFRL